MGHFIIRQRKPGQQSRDTRPSREEAIKGFPIEWLPSNSGVIREAFTKGTSYHIVPLHRVILKSYGKLLKVFWILDAIAAFSLRLLLRCNFHSFYHSQTIWWKNALQVVICVSRQLQTNSLSSGHPEHTLA